MDTNNFRKVSQPNVYDSYSKVKIDDSRFKLPMDNAPDNRYPKWAAIMSDGRLATSYNNHCSQNIPTGSQFPTKHWLINNSEGIIDYSRKHQFPITRSLDKSVLPPPSQKLDCSKSECNLQETNLPNGIGIERSDNNTPELFGTFESQGFEEKPQNSMVTNYFEGGRNTPRGTYKELDGVYHLKKKNDY
uniref:Uncharacterized protein n=1 Tax=viral metagenome TaxID=1070528 RepID=A0A6C0D717_9ZZZZ